jgi:hypothetical protein
MIKCQNLDSLKLFKSRLAGEGCALALILLATACSIDRTPHPVPLVTNTPVRGLKPSSTPRPTPTSLPGLGITIETGVATLGRMGFTVEGGTTSRLDSTVKLVHGRSSEIVLTVTDGFISRATMTIYHSEMDQYSRSFPDFLRALTPNSEEAIMDWIVQAIYLETDTVTGLVDGYALQLHHFDDPDFLIRGPGDSLTIWRPDS